jgi:hypothetical protein
MPPNSGPQGPSGPPGLQGPAGATGPRGPAGAAGQVELITCTTVTKIVKGNRRKLQQCTGRLVSGPLKFTAAAAAARATISRGPVIYATGVRVQLGDGHTQLLVSQARPIHPGRYTLTIRTRRHNRLRIRQQTIQIG